MKGVDISIHKALTGLDLLQTILNMMITAFQSTRPSRASTSLQKVHQALSAISIHKALTGLDSQIHIRTLRLDISIHKALTGLDEINRIDTV